MSNFPLNKSSSQQQLNAQKMDSDKFRQRLRELKFSEYYKQKELQHAKTAASPVDFGVLFKKLSFFKKYNQQ